jgi:hypothetical protein
LLLGVGGGLVTGVATSVADVAPASMTIVAVGKGASSAVVATRYRRPLEVRVLDASGTPVAGASVTFMLGSAGTSSAAATGAAASFDDGSTQAMAATDAAGLAVSPRFTAGTTAGSFVAGATVAGGTGRVAFALRNLPGQPAAIAPGVGSGQAGELGGRFPVRLAVTVTDAHGNVVPGALVTFSAPVEGPRGSFVIGARGLRARTVRVATGATGIAVAPPFAATAAEGGYIVRATVPHAAPAAFALVNQPAGS